MNPLDTSVSLESPDILCNIGYDPSGRSANFAQDNPEILPAQLQCSENGGDTTCNGDDTTTQRIQPDRGEASEGIESNDTTTETTSENRDQPQVKADEEEPQELSQSTVQEQNEQKAIKEATPVASRTRAGKQATSKRIDNSKRKSGQDTKRCEDKIRQLTRQVKEQQNIIDEMSSAITKFLKVQPVVKKIQGNIEKTLESAITQGKFKVKAVNRDQSIEMVKSFTPDTINSLEATNQNARDNAKACQQQSDTIAAQIKRLQDALQEAHEKFQTEPWKLQHCRDIVNCNSDLESLRSKAHQNRNQ